MKMIATIFGLMIGCSTAFAAQCQQLAGSYFFAHEPTRAMMIEQDGCALKITNRVSTNIGKPVFYSGDGSRTVSYETANLREMVAGTASADSYLLETKMLVKRTGEQTHEKTTLQLRSNGDILMKTLVSDGVSTESGMRLLVKE